MYAVRIRSGFVPVLRREVFEHRDKLAADA